MDLLFDLNTSEDKSKKALVKTAGLRVEIWDQDLQNTKQEGYPHGRDIL